MCRHEYHKLGQLVIAQPRGYDGAICKNVCNEIGILQCQKCGKVILRADVWKTLFE